VLRTQCDKQWRAAASASGGGCAVQASASCLVAAWAQSLEQAGPKSAQAARAQMSSLAHNIEGKFALGHSLMLFFAKRTLLKCIFADRQYCFESICWWTLEIIKY
jgi:hypothetical protein